MTGIPAIALHDAAAARAVVDGSAAGGGAIPRPPLSHLPYAPLVRALLDIRGFKLDFGAQTPGAALAMVADKLLGGGFAVERAAFAAEIAGLAAFAQAVAGGGPPRIALRSYFAPGDLVWHVDRVGEARAYRLLWGIGRPGGMWLTPRDNIDAGAYQAYMRHEYGLLGQLDTRVLATAERVEQVWAHRPRQLEAMRSGRFPFVRDPARTWQVPQGWASIHRVETPAAPGAFHRSSWDNARAPGLQVVITAAA